jgi:hypothetical protein
MILICANQQSALCLLGLQSSVKVLREVHTWILYLTTAGSSSQTWQGLGNAEVLAITKELAAGL